MVGTSEGFIGCVHSLRVGRRPIEFDVEKDPLIRSISKVFQCPVMSLSNQPSTTPMYSFYEPVEEEDGGGGGGGGELPNQISPVIFTHSPRLSESSSFVSFKVNPCLTTNPCQNHGLCWSDKGSPRGYKCVCHPEFSGSSLTFFYYYYALSETLIN